MEVFVDLGLEHYAKQIIALGEKPPDDYQTGALAGMVHTVRAVLKRILEEEKK